MTQYVSPSCVCHPRNKVVEEPALFQIDDIAEEPSASPIMDLDMDNELEEGMYIVVTYQEVNFPGIITLNCNLMVVQKLRLCIGVLAVAIGLHMMMKLTIS